MKSTGPAQTAKWLGFPRPRMRREWRLPTLRYRIIFDHCNPARPNVIKGGSCLTPAVAVDVAAGVTQPGAQLCTQGLCEGELTLEKTNRANGDLNKRKKMIRSQSYPTNHCVTLVHKPRFLHHWGQRVPVERRTATLMYSSEPLSYCAHSSLLSSALLNGILYVFIEYIPLLVFFFFVITEKYHQSYLLRFVGCGWRYKKTLCAAEFVTSLPPTALRPSYLTDTCHVSDDGFLLSMPWIHLFDESLYKKKIAKRIHTAPSPLLHLKSSCYACKMIKTNKQIPSVATATASYAPPSSPVQTSALIDICSCPCIDSSDGSKQIISDSYVCAEV